MNPAISFPKLTLVELRKMVDTRAGFWLQLGVAVLTLAVVVLVCIFGETSDFVFRDMLALAILPASILLPVVGILLVSSEWTQRTALITFTLVPKRMRVMSAKVMAGVVLGLAVLLIALIVASLAVLAVGGAWELGMAVFGQICVLVVTGMLQGVAFGAAFMNSATAIVLYFVLPFVFTALAAIPAVEDIGRWINLLDTTGPLTEPNMTGTEWARFLVSLLVWLALPLAVGLYRITKGEIRAG